MQPIRELPALSARAVTCVCFDVDDTVTTHGTLDPAAYRAMFLLKERGLKLIAVTGRPLGFAEIIARTWPVDCAVGENGAGYIAKHERALRTGYWDPVELRATQQRHLLHIRERVADELPEIAVSSDAWARRCDLAFDIGEHANVSEPRINQLVRLLEAEGARASVSSIHAHAQLGTHDKARGVSLAADALWALPEQEVRGSFLFVGDSGNDAAAFSFFALSVGVANVRAHLARLPTPPRFVTQASFGAGFAELAEVLLTRREETA